MFNFLKPRKADVLSHWYALIPGFNTSTKEFYDAITKELKDRQVPGLEIFRVDFAEGGVLSNKREYLRLTRERLVFDICAAPFGTAFFFSCRFAEIPAAIQLWQLLILAAALGFCGVASFLVCVRVFLLLAPFVWFFSWITLLILTVYALRNAVSAGLKDLDAVLIKSPVLGPIYENWFRKETYYRQDTRLMYLDTVNAVVKAKVEETTGAKGIKLVRFMEHSPILSELYKPVQKSLPQPPT
jgi:hypothetical protein